MKKNIFFILCAFLLGGINGSGQSELFKYVDTTILSSAKVEGMDGLNTAQFEFSPTWYEEGILFVYANTEKKRIKQKEELNFNLRYSAGGNKLDFRETSELPDLFIKGSIEGPACFAPDQNKLFLTRNLLNMDTKRGEDEITLGIYIYEKKEDQWMLTGELPVNSVEYNSCHPTWDEQGKRLIFASDMPGGFGKLDLYEIKYTPEGNWTRPMNLGPSINGTANDCFPFIHELNYLFYSSNRSEPGVTFDLYFSRQIEQQWMTSGKLPRPINSKSDDLGLIMDREGKNLLFSSSRPGGKGKDDLYFINLEKSFLNPNPAIHSIEILSAASGQLLENCHVHFFTIEKTKPRVIEQDGELNLQYSIKKDLGEPVQKHISDKEGLVHFNLEANDYLLSVEKENFATLQTLITISERPFYLKLKLDSLICRPLDFTFLDSETGKKIEDVQIESDEPLYYSGDEYEEKMPCVMPSTKFEVHFLHPSYKTTPFNIAYESVKKEAIKVYMDPALEMTELLVETGDVFVLKNILYAFDSHVLNKNAKEELDKLVDHLFLHPELSIELSSHTDSRGGEKYNQILSDKRAATAKKYLIDKGIQSSRIAAIGYGESRLLNECGDGVPCTEEKHLINRRIEVKVIERK